MENLAKNKNIAKKFMVVYTMLFAGVFLAFITYEKLNGKTFMYYYDGYNQYFPAYIYTCDYLKVFFSNLFKGVFEFPMFDFNIGFGEDLFVSLNHYGFTDPFIWLTFWIPSKLYTYGYEILIFVRIYLCGITFYLFCSYKKIEWKYILPGALIYAFSTVCLTNGVYFPNFTNPIIVLPLFALGAEKILNNEKPHIFILSIILLSTGGFYFLYMESIFIFVYVLVILYTVHGFKIKSYVKPVLNGIISYVIGILISMIILLPVIIGFLSSSRSGVSPEINILYSFSDYVRNSFGVFSAYSVAPCVSVSSVCLIMLVYVFRSENVSHKYLKLLLIILCIFFVFPIFGIMFNGFTGYGTQRWYFFINFVIGLSISSSYGIDISKKKDKIYALIISAFYVLLCIGVCFIKKDTKIIYASLLSSAILIIMTVSLKIFIKSTWNYYVISLLLVFIGTIGNNAVLYIPYNSNLIDTNEININNKYEQIIQNVADNSTKNTLAYENMCNLSSVINNYNGMNRYLSICNMTSHEFLENMSSSSYTQTNQSMGVGDRTLLNSLLRNKYYLIEKGQEVDIPYGYDLIRSESDFKLYENKNLVPFGSTYDSMISYEEYMKLESLQKQEVLLQKAVIDDAKTGNVDNTNFFNHNVPFKIKKTNGVEIEENTIKVVGSDNAYIDIEFEPADNMEIYLELNNLNILESELEILYSGVSFETKEIKTNYVLMTPNCPYYYLKENVLINLGHNYSDEKATVRMKFSDNLTLSCDDIKVYAEDVTKLPEFINRLEENKLQDIEIYNNSIKGNISVDKNKVLVVNVPYSKGWTAYSNGKKLDVIRANDMFCGVILEPGEHNIEFKYRTSGLVSGTILSILGCILWFIYAKVSLRKIKG